MSGLDWRKANKPTASDTERCYSAARPRSTPPRKKRKPAGVAEGTRVFPTEKEVAWLKALRAQSAFFDAEVLLVIKARAEAARARGRPLTPLAKVQIETGLRQRAIAKAASGEAKASAWRAQGPSIAHRPRVPLWKQIEERQEAQAEANKAFAEAMGDLTTT